MCGRLFNFVGPSQATPLSSARKDFPCVRGTSACPPEPAWQRLCVPPPPRWAVRSSAGSLLHEACQLWRFNAQQSRARLYAAGASGACTVGHFASSSTVLSQVCRIRCMAQLERPKRACKLSASGFQRCQRHKASHAAAIQSVLRCCVCMCECSCLFVVVHTHNAKSKQPFSLNKNFLMLLLNLECASQRVLVHAWPTVTPAKPFPATAV